MRGLEHVELLPRVCSGKSLGLSDSELLIVVPKSRLAPIRIPYHPEWCRGLWHHFTSPGMIIPNDLAALHIRSR